MRQSRQHKVLLSIMAALILVVVAACGGESGDDPTTTAERPTLAPETPVAQATTRSATLDADGDGFLVASEVEQAVYLVFDDYQWPDGYTPTVGDVVDGFFGNTGSGSSMEDDRYEVGMEHNVIHFWHTCAWYMTWLDAYETGNSELQAESLDVMTNVLPYHPSYETSAQELIREVADQAALGDPSLVVRRIEQDNCADFRFARSVEDGSGTVANMSMALPENSVVPSTGFMQSYGGNR